MAHLTQIIQMNVPKILLYELLVALSTMLIVTMELFLIGPLKSSISQPLWNANFIDLSRLRNGGF
jgi:hypothetical protein